MASSQGEICTEAMKRVIDVAEYAGRETARDPTVAVKAQETLDLLVGPWKIFFETALFSPDLTLIQIREIIHSLCTGMVANISVLP